MLVRAGMEWMMKRVDDRSYEKKKMLYSIKVILVFQFKSLEFSSLHCKSAMPLTLRSFVAAEDRCAAFGKGDPAHSGV